MRDKRGRFANEQSSTNTAIRYGNLELGRGAKKDDTECQAQSNPIATKHDHDYLSILGGKDAVEIAKASLKIDNSKVNLDWKEGRTIIELGVLLENLRYCEHCHLGPVPLTATNLIGELPVGLGGYLYVLCTNISCQKINRVPYGKTHRTSEGKRGMRSFVVNTKLGLGKIFFQ